MAAVETPLQQVALMVISDLNDAGGLLGREIEPVVADPASNWPLFAEKARELLEKERVSVVFGAHTSVSRRSVVPAFEQAKGLLFYPAQYEGEVPSDYVFYTGAVPNQSVVVVADYLRNHAPLKPANWVVLATDYVTARMQERTVREHLVAAGVSSDALFARFVPFGQSEFKSVVDDLLSFGEPGNTVVLNLLYEDSAPAFQRELRSRRTQRRIPVYWFGLDETALAREKSLYQGEFVARSYFSTLNNAANTKFKSLWARWQRQIKSSAKEAPRLNDHMEATYLSVNLWAQAVAAAQSARTEQVTANLPGLRISAPSGFELEVDSNHHLHKPFFIGKVSATGSVKVIWQTPGTVRPMPVSDGVR